MLPIVLALALLAQDSQPAEAAAPPPAEDRHPTGAPRDDYQFVAWCYGALRGYLDLREEVMPEVVRIESAFRRPGSKLEDDLKVYDDMQAAGREKLKLFESAITAAEKASIRPISAVGAEAVKRGRNVWTAGPDVTKARKAQEWMSWALPAKCETTAEALEKRAALAGAAFRINEEPEAPASEASASEAAAEDAPAEAPAAQEPAAEAPTE